MHNFLFLYLHYKKTCHYNFLNVNISLYKHCHANNKTNKQINKNTCKYHPQKHFEAREGNWYKILKLLVLPAVQRAAVTVACLAASRYCIFKCFCINYANELQSPNSTHPLTPPKQHIKATYHTQKYNHPSNPTHPQPHSFHINHLLYPTTTTTPPIPPQSQSSY